jgi:hypothetical protein
MNTFFNPHWLFSSVENGENRHVLQDAPSAAPAGAPDPAEVEPEEAEEVSEEEIKEWEKKIKKGLKDASEGLKTIVRGTVFDDAKITTNERIALEESILFKLREVGADIPDELIGSADRMAILAIDAGLFTDDDYLRARAAGRTGGEINWNAPSEEAGSEALQQYREAEAKFKDALARRREWGKRRSYGERQPQDITDALRLAQDEMRIHRQEVERATGKPMLKIIYYKPDVETRRDRGSDSNQEALAAAMRMANKSGPLYLGNNVYCNGYRSLAIEAIQNGEDPFAGEPLTRSRNFVENMYDVHGTGGTPISKDYIDSTTVPSADEKREVRWGEKDRLDTTPKPSAEKAVRNWFENGGELPDYARYYPDEETRLEAERRRSGNAFFERTSSQNAWDVIEDLGPNGKLRKQVENGEITDPQHIDWIEKLCKLYNDNSAKWKRGQELRNETRMMSFLHDALNGPNGLKSKMAERAAGIETQEQRVSALLLGPREDPPDTLKGNSLKKTYTFDKNVSSLIIDFGNWDTLAVNAMHPEKSSEAAILTLEERGIKLQYVPKANGGYVWNIHFYKSGEYVVGYKSAVLNRGATNNRGYIVDKKVNVPEEDEIEEIPPPQPQRSA